MVGASLLKQVKLVVVWWLKRSPHSRFLDDWGHSNNENHVGVLLNRLALVHGHIPCVALIKFQPPSRPDRGSNMPHMGMYF